MSVDSGQDDLNISKRKEALKDQLGEIIGTDLLLREVVKDKKALALAHNQGGLPLVSDKDGRPVVSLQDIGCIRVIFSYEKTRGGEWVENKYAEYRLFDVITKDSITASAIKPGDTETFKDFIKEDQAFICYHEFGEGVPRIGTFLAEQYYTNPSFTQPSAGEVGKQIWTKSGRRAENFGEAIKPYFNLTKMTG